MTQKYNTISTEIWRIVLPNNWAHAERGHSTQVYFESQDETMGVYLLSYRPDDPMTVLTTQAKQAQDLEILEKMEGSNWEVLDRWSRQEGNALNWGTECFDREKAYRIVVQSWSNGPFVIRASFHDYNCSNLDASREVSATIVGSFTFNDGLD